MRDGTGRQETITMVVAGADTAVVATGTGTCPATGAGGAGEEQPATARPMATIRRRITAGAGKSRVID